MHYKPFGETRLTNPLGTKYTFTGQLSHTDDFGLLFFNARWVDPELARFAQADTVVPDAYNPQDYDRYAYTRNNPLRYVDPSGHICLESNGTEICSMDDDSNGWWADTGESCRANPNQPLCWGINDNDYGIALPEVDLMEILDNWVWENLPSAIGINHGTSFQIDDIAGYGVIPVEVIVIFNWRSGEISTLLSPSAYAYFGTPGGFGLTSYIGTTYVFGASSNIRLAGPFVSSSINASADMLGELGGSVVYGRSVDPINSLDWFVDKASGQMIQYYQGNIFVGLNSLPNGVDAGFSIGAGYTKMIQNYVIPWWPIP